MSKADETAESRVARIREQRPDVDDELARLIVSELRSHADTAVSGAVRAVVAERRACLRRLLACRDQLERKFDYVGCMEVLGYAIEILENAIASHE